MTLRFRRIAPVATVFIAASCFVGIPIVSSARSEQPVRPVCSGPDTGSDCGERKPRTLIACLNYGRFEYFSRPKRCDLFSRTGPERETIRDIRTRRLHWLSWGGAKAEAEGTDSGGQPLRVVPYNPVRCRGAFYYRLAEVRRLRSGRTYQLRLARCGQVRFRP